MRASRSDTRAASQAFEHMHRLTLALTLTIHRGHVETFAALAVQRHTILWVLSFINYFGDSERACMFVSALA